MPLVAVFVDAGYLFATGSAALTESGKKQQRRDWNLNVSEAIAQLTTVARTKSENASLLRIYWYDGAITRGSLTREHEELAHTDFIKLRLGSMTAAGQQKGVDSLIVTDLIDLARNHAINDAVLLSGDEDVRIGVQIAQSYGVRVHLIGITPCRGSQSISLIQEADTTTEWQSTVVAKFLQLRPGVSEIRPAHLPVAHLVPSVKPVLNTHNELESVAQEILSELQPHEIDEFLICLFSDCNAEIPRSIDGKLLARSRARIGRDLYAAEKRDVRGCFKSAITCVYPSSGEGIALE